jgi:HD-like signal output (HDOD) protein
MDIIKIIENIPPLPNTVLKINQVASDPESAVKDLAKEIKTDPIATANILKEANSPLYGFKNVDTIEKAVMLFGKDTSRAIALSALAKESLEIDLSPYDISNDDFSKISQKRSFLMLKWYSRVDMSKLSILSISALLGNLGQIIIAKALLEQNRVDWFQDIIKDKGLTEAENEAIGSTTVHVTSMILRHWNLDKTIVDSIEYSDNYNEADESIKKLALANSVVYDLIDGRKKIAYNIDEKLEETLVENKMKPNYLKMAIESILD